jgi:hypothetical protein
MDWALDWIRRSLAHIPMPARHHERVAEPPAISWEAEEFHRLADTHSAPPGLLDEVKAKARAQRGLT